jgi:hypothetical protein
MLTTVAPTSIIRATILTPIHTPINYLITINIISVGIRATLTIEGIIISTYLTIHTDTLYMPCVLGVIILLTMLTIDTTILT